ncbi:MAG: thioredoxin [bacterium]|nr:thioredoxin [bacterium]
MATELTNDNFQSTLDAAGDKPVFVDFYAEWCGPCKIAEPIVEKLAVEYADKVLIAKLDIDENREIAQKYGVMSIPTVIMFKKGQPVDQMVGFQGEQGYRKLLDSAPTLEAAA